MCIAHKRSPVAAPQRNCTDSPAPQSRPRSFGLAAKPLPAGPAWIAVLPRLQILPTLVRCLEVSLFAVFAIVGSVHVRMARVRRCPAPIRGRAVRVLPKPAGLAGPVMVALAVVLRLVKDVVFGKIAVGASERLTASAALAVGLPLGLGVWRVLFHSSRC